MHTNEKDKTEKHYVGVARSHGSCLDCDLELENRNPRQILSAIRQHVRETGHRGWYSEEREFSITRSKDRAGS